VTEGIPEGFRPAKPERIAPGGQGAKRKGIPSPLLPLPMPILSAPVREKSAGVEGLRSCSSASFVSSLWCFSCVLVSGRSGFFASLIAIHQTSASNQRVKLVCLVYLVDLVCPVGLTGKPTGRTKETRKTGWTK
jgi:hypothetical protein